MDQSQDPNDQSNNGPIARLTLKQYVIDKEQI